MRQDGSKFVSHSKAELDFSYLIKIRLHPRDFDPSGQTRFMKVMGMEEHDVYYKVSPTFFISLGISSSLVEGPSEFNKFCCKVLYRGRYLLKGDRYKPPRIGR